MNILTEYRILDGDPTSEEYDVALYNFWKDESLHKVEYEYEELSSDLIDRGVDPESVERLSDYGIIDHQGTFIFINSFNLRKTLKVVDLTRKEKEQLHQAWRNFSVLN